MRCNKTEHEKNQIVTNRKQINFTQEKGINYHQKQKLIKLLNQFNISTKELSAQSHPIIAYVRIILFSIYANLKTYNNEKNNLLKQIAMAIYNILQNY